MLSRIKQPIFLELPTSLKCHFTPTLCTVPGGGEGHDYLVAALQQQNAMYETNTLEILFRIKSMSVEGNVDNGTGFIW